MICDASRDWRNGYAVGMSAYVPPYPVRPDKPLPLFTLLRTARRNLLAIWPVQAFSLDMFSHRVLRRTVHVINSPQAVKEAFIDGAAVFERKSSQQRNALKPLIGDGLFITEGRSWRERRRLVAPVTHVSRMAALAPAISAAAAGRSAAWRSLPDGAELDVMADMAHLTAGIICTTLFGTALGDGAADTITSSFSHYQSLVGQLDLLGFLGVPQSVPRFQGLRIGLAARRIHRALDGLIDTMLRAGDGAGSSLVGAMLQSSRDGTVSPLGRRALLEEAATLFLAGHETTANTLAWAWFLLSQDPDTERRLHAEVDAVLGEGPAAHGDMARLPFTRAVVEETLRLYPPVPLQVRQAMADTRLGGRTVRKGDLVVLNAWLLHRNGRIWAEPDSFLPERFLPGAPTSVARHAYVPFSIGPRVCTGAAFALTEAVLCLATLARHVRLRLKPGWVVEPVARLSLRPGETLPMLIEHRRAASS